MSDKPSPSDLSSLISNAAKEAARPSRLNAPVRRSRPGAFAGTALLLMVAAACWALYASFAPPSKKQVAADLGEAIALARKSVEAERTRTGQLPDVLPNASLAAVVRYTPDNGQYRLETTILGIRVTLQKDGSISTDTDDSK